MASPDPTLPPCDLVGHQHAGTSTWSALPHRPSGPPDTHNFAYTCSKCKRRVGTCWRCTVCKAHYLCVSCVHTTDHGHEMQNQGLSLDGDGNTRQAAAALARQESRRLSILRCIQALAHACRCRSASCSLSSCKKMKQVVQHTKKCARRNSGGCPICKQVIALCCYHAKHCQETRCPVPFCLNIKHKLWRQWLQHRLQQAQVLRRRMASMQRASVDT